MNKQFIGQYVSDAQLGERYGVSRSTIWRWVKRGLLPPPISISPGCTRWNVEQVAQRDAERDSQAA